MITFIHHDMAIHNPFLSDCGRLFVDPREAYGFEEYHTGGGCMALRLQQPEGRYILLTDKDGCRIPDHWEDALIGLYDKDGEMIEFNELTDEAEQ